MPLFCCGTEAYIGWILQSPISRSLQILGFPLLLPPGFSLISCFPFFISPHGPCLWSSTASSIQPIIVPTFLFRPDLLLSHNALMFVWSIGFFFSYQRGVVFGSTKSRFLKEMSKRNPIWELPLKMNGCWVGVQSSSFWDSFVVWGVRLSALRSNNWLGFSLSSSLM